MNSSRINNAKDEDVPITVPFKYDGRGTSGNFRVPAYSPEAPIRVAGTRRKPSFRMALCVLLGIGVLGMLITGCSNQAEVTASAPASAPEVPVIRLASEQVPWEFEFTGYTAASHQVEIRPRVGGYLVQTPFTEGEFVQAGTLLFEIDPRPFLAAQARARAEVAQAQAVQRLAQAELARAERLASDNAIATEELERRQKELETSRSALSAAIAQQAIGDLDVEFTRIKSPVAGRVSRALVRPGNLVSGGDANGTLLTTVVAVNPLHVHFSIDEPTFLRLTELKRAGQSIRAEVQVGSLEPLIGGYLDYLSPVVDHRSGTAQARLILANPEGRMAPGLFTRVRLVVESEQPRLLVPETAVGTQQGSRYVLVVGSENKVVYRPIILGERRGNNRIVSDGLAEGESIVINGLHRLRPGMTVRPIEAVMAAN